MIDIKTRRRGKILEEAILGAAWEELLVVGYQKFSIEAVVKRARTSRSVIYRRWNSKTELFEAALLHYFETNVPCVPDTGTLRDDLVTLLEDCAKTRARLMILLHPQMVDYFQDTNSKPSDLREKFLAGVIDALDAVLLQAIKRGEISARPLPDRLRDLPFDLLRSESFMSLEPPTRQTIEQIVDMILMPLIRFHQAGGEGYARIVRVV